MPRELLHRIGSGRSRRLYILALHDRGDFREYPKEYWPTFRGRLLFDESAEAAFEKFTTSEPEKSPSTRSVSLCMIVLHAKASYSGFFGGIALNYPTSGIESPYLILWETEAEHPAKRVGMGITDFYAEVWLPPADRDLIRKALVADQGQNRTIVLGFPVDEFDLPVSRHIERDKPFDARKWVFSADEIELCILP